MKINGVVGVVSLSALLTGCTLSESIIIEAPVEAVWGYVSASENAAEWSVYFHHIAPLPSAVNDGAVGSIRRCFRSAAEMEDIWWDELVLEVREQRYRRILSYNAHGLNPPFLNTGEFYVHQKYEPLNSARTRLTFSAEQLRPAGLLMKVRFHGAAREGRKMFRLNLENIRTAVEAQHQQRPVERLHPYLPPGRHKLDGRRGSTAVRT
ncbi:hypothetical protein BH23GEM6_BH23GEM6_24660 [soil metagenome]